MHFKWKQLRGGRHGVPGMSLEQQAAFNSARAAIINEAQSSQASATRLGKRRHQQDQAIESTSDNILDVETFEDFNDEADELDENPGNNAANKFEFEAAFDVPWDPNNANSAFDPFTISLSNQVKFQPRTWAAGRKQRALAWESHRSANVLNVMASKWPSVEGKLCGVDSCPKPVSITCETCRLQYYPHHFCDQHAIFMHNQPAGHALFDYHGDPWNFPSLRQLTCTQCATTGCDKKSRIKLHSLHGINDVELVMCSLHSASSILCQAGYFPSAPVKPAAAFSFEILEITLKFQNEKSNKVSNYGAAMAFFNHDESPYMNKVHNTVYKQFNECLNEYSIVKHLFKHCRFTSGIVEQFGPAHALERM
ncbi:hypothetical protein BJ741DRAFT_75694 [Chytriomyces cf. hyalinus JEL632]|nr:hypothetical protein BJ741DRAFT_75694 [Chytriomyces cf. hyalinus JEL632]